MNQSRKIRGSGYKHSLPAVLPFSAVWIFVVVVTAPMLTIFMMLGDIVPESSHSDIWFFLLTRTPLIALDGGRQTDSLLEHPVSRDRVAVLP